jgi:hypothetical protein
VRSRIQGVFVHWTETVHIAKHAVGAVVATHAAKDDAAAAAGRVVSQGWAIVVEKVFAREYADNETREVAGYMEVVVNEYQDCWVLHPHLGRAQSGAVSTIAALGRTEFGVPAVTADWEAFVVDLVADDKGC